MRRWKSWLRRAVMDDIFRTPLTLPARRVDFRLLRRRFPLRGTGDHHTTPDGSCFRAGSVDRKPPTASPQQTVLSSAINSPAGGRRKIAERVRTVRRSASEQFSRRPDAVIIQAKTRRALAPCERTPSQVPSCGHAALQFPPAGRWRMTRRRKTLNGFFLSKLRARSTGPVCQKVASTRTRSLVSKTFNGQLLQPGM